MKRALAVLCLLFTPLLPAARAGKPPLIPLVFVHGEDEATIRRVVREVADGGNTGFVWESRPHPDYLGPRWWKDLGIALDEAKRLGLEVWLFDEWMYPSGVAGGKVVAADPELSVHTVADRALTVDGPSTFSPLMMPGPEAKIIAVRAFPARWTEGATSIDLTPKGRRFTWDVPAGKWRVVWVVEQVARAKPGWTMDNMIDVMNPRAAAAFIRITHEATYQHFGAEFGKTIKGFFSDEAGFRNITSYDSLPGTPGMPLPWSPALAEYFKSLKGYDPLPVLPALWYDLGARGRQFRFDFMDVCSRAFAEHFFKPQQQWCHAHSVRLIGHLVEDNGADHQLGYGPGHWFRAMRFFDMPGIDMVGYQVTPGLDSGTYRWTLPEGADWDEEHFSFALPAMARGSALEKKTTEIFAESFGAYGWSEGLRTVKWLGDWLIVNGINVISPHAVTLKHHDADCPPHFNASSGNPQARYYRSWAEPFSRLQELTRESEPLYDAVVLYTGESAWMGQAQNVAPVVRSLETAQVSTVVLPYDTFETAAAAQTVLVLPYVEWAPAPVLERLAALASAGRPVFVLENWPRNAPQELERSARLLPLAELAGQVRHAVRLEPATDTVVVSRRKAPGGEWILLHNRSLRSTYRGRLNARATRFDAASGKWFEAPEIELPPYTLWVLWTGAPPEKPIAPPRYEPLQAVAGAWEMARAGGENNAAFETLDPRKMLEDWRRWAGLDHYSGTLRYYNKITVADPRGLGLDAGEVREIVELFVNGRPAGVRIAPPYVWDISALAQAGENAIELDVTNTAQARWADEFSHGDAVSGLLGPVRLVRAR